MPQLARRPGAQHLHSGAQIAHDLLGGAHPDVGLQQGVLDLLPRVLVQDVPGEQGEQPAAKRRLRARQPGAQPDQPAGGRCRGLQQQIRRRLHSGRKALVDNARRFLDADRAVGAGQVDGGHCAFFGIPRSLGVVTHAGRVVDPRSRLSARQPPAGRSSQQADGCDHRKHRDDENQYDEIHRRSLSEPVLAVTGLLGRPELTPPSEPSFTAGSAEPPRFDAAGRRPPQTWQPAWTTTAARWPAMRLREFFQRLFRRRRARGGGSPHHRPAPQSVEVAASAISSPPVEPPEPMPASPSSPPPQPPAGPPVAPPLATPAPEPPAPATAHAATPAADSWPDTLRLRRLTDELLPPPVATRLLALVRPTIDVVPADVDADLDAASSRIGGNPLLPPQLRWPHRDGAPLSFLAQVRLEEVAPYDVEGALPPSGLLLFFYGGAEDAWGFDPDDRLSWRVLLVDPD